MTGWKASFVRIGRLVAARAGQELSILGIVLAALCCLNLAGIFLAGMDWLGKDFGTVWWTTMIVLVTIRATRAFSELDQDPSATEWILFPATPTEKYIAAQLRWGVLYYGLALSAALAMSAAMGWLNSVVNGGPMHWLGEVWFGAAKTSVTVNAFSIDAPVAGFLWGMICVGASAVFGKHAVWKVLVTIFGAVLLWFVVMAAVHWIVFADQTQLLMSDRDQAFRTIGFLLSNWQTPALDTLISQWWCGILLPAYFIVYGWAKLREVEARHAVQP